MSSLDNEFHGAVTVRTMPSTEPEAIAVVKAEGWRSHGARITRGDKVIYRAGDHRVLADEIHDSLRASLGLPYDCR